MLMNEIRIFDLFKSFCLNVKRKTCALISCEKTKRKCFFLSFFLFFNLNLTLVTFFWTKKELDELYDKNLLLFYLIFAILAIMLGSFKVLTHSRVVDNKIFLELFLFYFVVSMKLMVASLILCQLENKSFFINNKMLNWFLVFSGINIEVVLFIINIERTKWKVIPIVSFSIRIIVKNIFLFNIKTNEIFYAILFHIIESIIIPGILYCFQEKFIQKLFTNDEILDTYEKLVDSIITNEIFVLSTNKLEILYFNKSAELLFHDKQIEGLKSIHLKNSNFNLLDIYYDFILNEREINEYQNYRECLLEGFSSNSQFSNIPCEIDAFLGLINWKDEKAILVALKNNSNAKKIKNLTKTNDYKDILLASVSHDLRSPLNSLQGLLHLAHQKIKDEICSQYIATAIKSTNILLYMINDFLDFAQIQLKKLNMNLEECSLIDIIDDVIPIIQFQALQKSLSFDFIIEKNAKTCKIFADSRRTKQILLNLLGNAIKFTAKGFVKLKIFLEDCPFHDYSHQKITFQVVDSGIGIKKKHQDCLFKLFSKVYQKNKNLNKYGIGLGLSISQQLAKFMHEEGIQVESDVGKGSSFYFSLPIFQNNADEEFQLFERAKINEIHIFKTNSSFLSSIHKEIKVLFVDDDPMNLMIGKKYLESFGLLFETANNGFEALQQIEYNKKNKQYFSLIILDAHMPIMSGFEAAAKINAMIANKGIPPTPIISISGTEEGLMQEGVQGFLRKPVRRENLKEMISRILRIHIN